MTGELEKIIQILRRLGYKPIIIGTYALILQGWLPKSFLRITKDIDIYVNNPDILFDLRVKEEILREGLQLGRTEVGGLYIQQRRKPIEILYPIYDIYIPNSLLRETLKINQLTVLEGHAVLISKALGGDITYLASYLRKKPVVDRLKKLLITIRSDPAISFNIVKRRVAKFLEKLRVEDVIVREVLCL